VTEEPDVARDDIAARMIEAPVVEVRASVSRGGGLEGLLKRTPTAYMQSSDQLYLTCVKGVEA